MSEKIKEARAAIAKGLKTMAAAMEKDPGFRVGYQANVACLLMDRYDLDHETSNRAADEILKLMFES